MVNDYGSSGEVRRPMQDPNATMAAPFSVPPMATTVPPMASSGDLDRELEALAQGVRQKRRNRMVFGGGLIAAALMAATVVVFTGKVKEAEAAQAEAVAARIAEQDRINQLNLQMAERDRQIADLTAALTTAKNDAEKAPGAHSYKCAGAIGT